MRESWKRDRRTNPNDGPPLRKLVDALLARTRPAETLALFRIVLGCTLLIDQLQQWLPRLDYLLGPHGIVPAGFFDWQQVRSWRWTIWLFNHDEPAVYYPLFAAWVAATLAWMVGFWTRLTNVAVWVLTMCMFNRNRCVLNSGNDVLTIGIFLLMVSACGKAFSVDAWLARRRGRLPPGRIFVPVWPVRLMQFQLCVMYTTTGIIKLKGYGWGTFQGSWLDGTSLHYVLNHLDMLRWSYAQLPLPLWITRSMTYACLAWEVLFPLLVLFRLTRRWTLLFGLLFHLGVWLSMDIGYFSFYTMAFYTVWIPNEFWEAGEEIRRNTPWKSSKARWRESLFQKGVGPRVRSAKQGRAARFSG